MYKTIFERMHDLGVRYATVAYKDNKELDKFIANVKYEAEMTGIRLEIPQTADCLRYTRTIGSKAYIIVHSEHAKEIDLMARLAQMLMDTNANINIIYLHGNDSRYILSTFSQRLIGNSRLRAAIELFGVQKITYTYTVEVAEYQYMNSHERACDRVFDTSKFDLKCDFGDINLPYINLSDEQECMRCGGLLNIYGTDTLNKIKAAKMITDLAETQGGIKSHIINYSYGDNLHSLNNLVLPSEKALQDVLRGINREITWRETRLHGQSFADADETARDNISRVVHIFHGMDKLDAEYFSAFAFRLGISAVSVILITDEKVEGIRDISYLRIDLGQNPGYSDECRSAELKLPKEVDCPVPF